MGEGNETIDTDRLDLAVAIVSAYVAKNRVQPDELPSLIGSVHAALGALGGPSAPAEPQVDEPTPAQIRKSITHEALISFIDGKPYKTLKRHLKGHGLDPGSYRRRFGLPADYPMVAPSYSEARSALAKSLGLGRIGTTGVPPEADPSATLEGPVADKARGRRRKIGAA
ncbi:MucR family transcriptional regulator [uncultured Methylobacterium sp.]|uniref:MucR family transcriptional regulator n=1 Tax=uncultured Methylobacterium sp. TaxID=157278 RepID=UPI00259A65D0|nr:MucR family transcriptional regulator [uncultured Methylobacterium sp.]